jgi:PAS domain S-box-containing protein
MSHDALPPCPTTVLNDLIARLEDDVTTPVVVLSESETVLFVSTAYVRVTGYERHERVGRRFADCLHPDDQQHVRQWLAATRLPAGDIASARYRVRGGSWKSFRFTLAWCTLDGECIGIVRMSPASGEAAERPLVTRCNIHQTLFGLEPVLRRIVGPTVEVVYSLDATSVHIPLSSFQLEQVVVHLASNARHAMPAGGQLRIATRNRLTWPSDPEQPVLRQIELTMSDTGMGLSPRVSTQIFEPFFTTKSERGHAGLGLTIVHRLIERVGGQIGVESELGTGATFRVVLPVVGVV